MLTAASVRSFKLPRFHMTHFPHVQAVRGYAVILLEFFFVRFSLSEKFWRSGNFAIIHLYILFSSFFTSVCNQQHALMLAHAESQKPQLRRKLFKQLKHTSPELSAHQQQFRSQNTRKICVLSTIYWCLYLYYFIALAETKARKLMIC